MIEIIGVFLLATTPWMLKQLTSLLDWVTKIEVPIERKFFLRFGLACLSLIMAVCHASLSGEAVPIDTATTFVEALTVFVEAFIIWLSTTGLYELGRKRGQ